MGGVFNTVNASLYHYAGNNPVKYTDPDGRESGYLNDDSSVGGLGHSAMFVQLYDNPKYKYAIYEVGKVHQDENGKWIGDAPNSIALSHANLDSNMGLAVGSVSGVLGSPAYSVTNGSVLGEIAVDSIPITSGVSVRYYESYKAMKSAPENQRYNNVFIFNTSQNQDNLINSEALMTGIFFGKYNLFTNNCTQHASNALSKGGIDTTNFLIPNSATSYIRNHNQSSFMREGWR